MGAEEHNSFKISTLPLESIEDTSVYTNSSKPAKHEIDEGILDSQDQELLDILTELQTADPNVQSEKLATSGTTRITGYFCSDTVLKSH